MHLMNHHPRCSIRGSFGADRNSPGVFTKKIPQTSVAPTFKLTLPSDFVVAHCQHLIDKDFELVDETGRSWEVSILPRKNKDKFEYTLYGWKQFAVEHQVVPNDRLQFEIVPNDQWRICARINRRLAYREQRFFGSGVPGPGPLALPHPQRLALPFPQLTLGPHAGGRALSSPDASAPSSGGGGHGYDAGSPASVRTAPPGGACGPAGSPGGPLPPGAFPERSQSGSLASLTAAAAAGGYGRPSSARGMSGFTPYMMPGTSGLAPGFPALCMDPAGSRGVDSGEGDGASAQTRHPPQSADQGGRDVAEGGAGSGDTISDDNAWQHGPISGTDWHHPLAYLHTPPKRRKRDSADLPLSPGFKRAKESSNARQLLEGVVLSGSEQGDGMHLLSSVAHMALSGAQKDGPDEFCASDTPRTARESLDSRDPVDVSYALRTTEKDIERYTGKGIRAANSLSMALARLAHFLGPRIAHVHAEEAGTLDELLKELQVSTDVVLHVLYSVKHIPQAWTDRPDVHLA